MKILTIVGARPQFVKAATVSRAIKNHSDLTEIIVHTGQHFDKNMSDVFFEEMQIPQPNYHLNINSVGHGAMTGRMLEGIEEIIHQRKTRCGNGVWRYKFYISRCVGGKKSCM
jgi:UDP-GlcNAc3NAcA epimerase